MENLKRITAGLRAGSPGGRTNPGEALGAQPRDRPGHAAAAGGEKEEPQHLTTGSAACRGPTGHRTGRHRASHYNYR